MQFENAANHNLSVLPGKLFDLLLQLVRQKYRLYEVQLVRQKYRLYEVLTPQTL